MIESERNEILEEAARLLDNREANAKVAREQRLGESGYAHWNGLAIAANNWAKDIRSLKRPSEIEP